MRKNMDTRISGTNVILVPYQEKHVIKYHEWMKNPTLQYLTSSEPLTLDEEFEMQKRWLEDEDNDLKMQIKNMLFYTHNDIMPKDNECQGVMKKKTKECTFIILDKHAYLQTGDANETAGSDVDAMVGDTNLFLHNSQGFCIAEIEIMIADEASRGKRRGWESVILMLLYGAETLNINKFCAKIKLDNTMSIRMFEKLGFREVERSEVFQEVTLEKEASSDWISWLHSELRAIKPN